MLIEQLLPQLIGIALPALAVVAVLMWALGRASLGVLREIGAELPHRAEMQWGARWYWAVMTAVLVVPVVAIMVALTRTSYPATTAVVGALAIAPIGFLLHWLLPWQFHGAILWLVARRHGHGEAAARAIEQGECVCANWGPWVHRAVAAVFVGMMIWAGSTTIPLDRQLMQFERADQLGAAVAERVDSRALERAVVILDGMLPDAPGNRVLLEASEGASQEVLDELVQAAEPPLRALLPPGEWLVRARAGDDATVETMIVTGEQRAGVN
jgi:hypothetical protein